MRFGLCGVEYATEKLVDRVEGYWQRIGSAASYGADAMSIRPHHGKTIDEAPNQLIITVQYVRAVGVHHDTGRCIAISVAMSAGMFLLFLDFDREPGFRKHTRHRCPGQTCPDYQNPVAHRLRTLILPDHRVSTIHKTNHSAASLLGDVQKNAWSVETCMCDAGWSTALSSASRSLRALLAQAGSL